MIEYCINNVDGETRDALEACPVPTRAEYCMHRCGYCYTGPFVAVDGRLYREDHEEILDRLDAASEESE